MVTPLVASGASAMLTYESIENDVFEISQNILHPSDSELAEFTAGFLYGASGERCDSR